jgi:hypothetical protein
MGRSGCFISVLRRKAFFLGAIALTRVWWFATISARPRSGALKDGAKGFEYPPARQGWRVAVLAGAILERESPLLVISGLHSTYTPEAAMFGTRPWPRRAPQRDGTPFVRLLFAGRQ